MRTFGAKDKKKRKQRKTYRGKLIKRSKKSGKFVPYVSKRSRDSPIKLFIWEERPMSKLAYKNFSRKTRHYMRKIVFCPVMRIDADPYQISTKELVEQLCLDHLWEGVWLVKGFCHGKNKYHVKNVTLCKVKITEHPSGLQATMVENRRLFRYWFYHS